MFLPWCSNRNGMQWNFIKVSNKTLNKIDKNIFSLQANWVLWNFRNFLCHVSDGIFLWTVLC